MSVDRSREPDGVALATRLSAISSASLHEAAGRIGALPSRIKPVVDGMTVAGPAFPVLSPPGDNLWLHRAIYAAAAGDVVVVDVGGAPEFGYWGEVMVRAALARRLGGVVIDGGVRDAARLRELGFPVFSSGLCIRGTAKDAGGLGAVGSPVRIGDVLIRPGDLVVGDDDGVVVLPADRAAAIADAATARDAKERDIFARLDAGESTVEIYGLPGEAP